MRFRIQTLLLLMFLGVTLGGYVYAGLRQKAHLNRSATAGGQHPYLQNAERMAIEGGKAYFGDRNRMPLIPALVSIVYVSEWTRFVDRAALVALVSGTVLLVLVGAVCFATLPRLPALFVTLLAAVCVFLPKASFVQAELAYYTLLFTAWVVMCRVIHRPDWRWSAVAGAACGLAFWAKASAWPLMLAFVLVMTLRSGLTLRRGKRRRDAKPGDEGLAGPASVAMVGVIAFLLITGPYLRDTKEKFGGYLYNVNSTFFIWCDSWAEADAFATRYDPGHAYPEAPADQIPGLRRYLRTHTAGEIIERFAYGFSTLGAMALRSSYFKYVTLLALVAAYVAWKRRGLVRAMSAENWFVVAFCALIAGGYLTVYAWYALGAYGDRFILSLLLPVAFALSWCVARFGRKAGHVSLLGRRVRLTGVTFTLCSAALMIEGVGEAVYGTVTAEAAFVRFYFNESREAQLDGHREAALRGYRGVLELDSTFSPAHHELGTLAMHEGRLDEALHHLTEAVRYRENDPNMLNSLGSVLIQLGRLPEAVRALTLATNLDPDFVSAWYNLGVALHLAGDNRGAKRAVQRLDQLHPPTARRLRGILAG